LRRVIKERFPMEDKRIIFIRIPCLGKEPGGALALMNNKAIGSKVLSIVKEAEEAWDGYKAEYDRWGLKQEEFKQSLINVVNHFS
jgi:tubulin gamma